MKADKRPRQSLNRADLLTVVQGLPEETPVAAQLGGFPKEDWIKWLSGYIRPGDQGIHDQARDAGFIPRILGNPSCR
jgi:hypothetical protein